MIAAVVLAVAVRVPWSVREHAWDVAFFRAEQDATDAAWSEATALAAVDAYNTAAQTPYGELACATDTATEAGTGQSWILWVQRRRTEETARWVHDVVTVTATYTATYCEVGFQYEDTEGQPPS